jgi:hypothetical protein
MNQPNLGQSRFQDTFFVAGAQLTPFRQLRQIELELRSIDDAIHQAHINERKLNLKLKKLNPEVEEDLIEIDDIAYQRKQQHQLLQDALGRKINFEELKKLLLASVKQEYWDAGYEAAEAEHWPAYFAKQIGMSMAMGLPPPQNIVEQVLLLPLELQKKTILLAQEKAQTLQLTYGPPT